MGSSIVNAMLAIPQVAQMGTQIGRNKAQQQIEQAQEERAAQQADISMHEHLINDLGALPVVNGMVKQTIPLTAPAVTAALMGDQGGPGESSNMMDSQGNPNPGATFGGDQSQGLSQRLMQSMSPQQGTGNVTIVRKPDTARMVSWKDHTGDQVQYELPTEEDQKARAYARQMAAAQAEAQGRTAGTTAATPMVPTTPQYNAENNLPPGMTQMPVGSAINLSRATVPAGYRRDASEYGADTRAGASEYGADSRAKSAADVAALRSKSNAELADAKQQFEAYQNQLRLNYQDRWQAARNAVASNTQNSFYNRQLLRQFDSNEQQHAKLLDQTYKEQQKQLEAGALLDQARGVTDGEEFTDPWSGKKMTMNYAQRLRLQNGLSASQSQVADLKTRAGQIEQRFGVNSVVIPPLGSPEGGSAAGPSAAPSSSVAQPSPAVASAIPTPQAPRPGPTVNAPPQQRPTTPAPAAAAPQAKIASQAQVNAYAQKKGITPAAALQEFKAAHYTVQ